MYGSSTCAAKAKSRQARSNTGALSNSTVAHARARVCVHVHDNTSLKRAPVEHGRPKHRHRSYVATARRAEYEYDGHRSILRMTRAREGLPVRYYGPHVVEELARDVLTVGPVEGREVLRAVGSKGLPSSVRHTSAAFEPIVFAWRHARRPAPWCASVI